ncbi:MAG: prepilin peptidase, partial [Tepidisphaerales bacterium]
MPEPIIILFIFAFGACVGSFLNVVVWRVPRGQSLVTPPSRCPSCETPLAWYDNIPVFGWLMLRGRCRYCAEPVSFRYPLVEFLTGAIFVFYYWVFFVVHAGPCIPHMVPGIAGLPKHVEYAHLDTIQQHWPIYGLYLFLVASLLAASLIDAELFIIPVGIPWTCAVVGLCVHSLIDHTNLPGNVMIGPRSLWGPLTMGSGFGLLVSMVLFLFGKLPPSFPDGEPELEVDKEMRAEAGKPSEPDLITRLIARLIDAYRGQPTPAQLKLMQANGRARDRSNGRDRSPSGP